MAKTIAGLLGSDVAVHFRPVERIFTADTTSNAEAGAGLGGLLGGALGLGASVAGFAVPGAGPMGAASPMLMALTGAVVGAFAGGLIGALAEEGLAETVRREGARIARHAERAVAILRNSGAIDTDQRVSRWRDKGSTAGSAPALPHSPDKAERERRQYGTHADPLTRLPLTADPELDNVLETTIRR